MLEREKPRSENAWQKEKKQASVILNKGLDKCLKAMHGSHMNSQKIEDALDAVEEKNRHMLLNEREYSLQKKNQNGSVITWLCHC